MINEFDNIKECTDNYADEKEIMSELSISDLCKAVDLINAMSNIIPQNNEVQDEVDSVLEPLYDIIVQLRVENQCPHCDMQLYKSDLPQYDFVCPSCDENF